MLSPFSSKFQRHSHSLITFKNLWLQTVLQISYSIFRLQSVLPILRILPDISLELSQLLILSLTLSEPHFSKKLSFRLIFKICYCISDTPLITDRTRSSVNTHSKQIFEILRSSLNEFRTTPPIGSK